MEKKRNKTDTDNSMVTTRGKGSLGEREENTGGINGEGRRLDLG